MHVVISQFVVANKMDEDVRDAFRNRPHLVDDAPGFIRMEVISPVDEPEKFWLMTYWQDYTSFESWHRSHLYQASHAGMPKGLKLVPGQNKVTHYNHICS
tara:strand:- start:4319 stop:4618 length:300 start_codon:yes stop_codon:yes gene_type:complete